MTDYEELRSFFATKLKKSRLNLTKKHIDGREHQTQRTQVLRVAGQIQQRHGLTVSFPPRYLTGKTILSTLYALCLVSVFVLAAPATATTPKPYQWTTAQASSALMRQAEDFYFSERGSVDLTSARCRGTGKSVQRRFVAFMCSAIAPNGQEYLNLRVLARTRRAGGICWAVAPAPIPFGCFAPGKRAEGSPRDAWVAAYKVIDDRSVQGGRCLAHGSGFFSCSWRDAQGEHRGTVTFAKAPVVKLLS